MKHIPVFSEEEFKAREELDAAMTKINLSRNEILKNLEVIEGDKIRIKKEIEK